jgi:multidrug efflux pump subunit AcrB
MMSMLTTIFGLAPVVFLPGAGTELYRGLGTIVLFGLFFSTVLALSFIPALLVLLFNAGVRWQHWQGRRQTPG